MAQTKEYRREQQRIIKKRQRVLHGLRPVFFEVPQDVYTAFVAACWLKKTDPVEELKNHIDSMIEV